MLRKKGHGVSARRFVVPAAVVLVLLVGGLLGSRWLGGSGFTIGVRVITALDSQGQQRTFVAALNPEVEAQEDAPALGIQILRVDGIPVGGLDADEVQRAFLGRRNGKVTLDLLGDDQESTISLRREVPRESVLALAVGKVTQGANIRSEADLNSRVIQTAAGTQCLALITTDASGDWVLVASPATHRLLGHVHASLIDPVPSCAGLVTVAESDLASLDGRMADAYNTLRDRLPPDESEALLLAQRAWLDERAQRCNTPLSIRVFEARPENRACLWGMIHERSLELESDLGR